MKSIKSDSITKYFAVSDVVDTTYSVKATWSVCGFLLQNHVNQYKL